jgi:hypothetical protein
VDLYTRGSIPIELLNAKAAELRELLHLLQEAIEHNERQRQAVERDDRSVLLLVSTNEESRTPSTTLRHGDSWSSCWTCACRLCCAATRSGCTSRRYWGRGGGD